MNLDLRQKVGVQSEVEAAAYEMKVSQPGRTFTLFDAMFLVAATAIGFAWVRSVWYFENFKRLMDWLDHALEMLKLLLATWMFATVALRMLPPRPPLRRHVLQPGAAACGAFTFAFTIECSFHFVNLFARNRGIPWYLFHNGYFGSELYMQVIVAGRYHYPIAAVWGLLLLSRRCHPEPSWIDRTGRALGLSWLLLALWDSSVYAIGEWGNHVHE
jgi:hypothetical protein